MAGTVPPLNGTLQEDEYLSTTIPLVEIGLDATDALIDDWLVKFRN